jgi:hypothetical protein
MDAHDERDESDESDESEEHDESVPGEVPDGIGPEVFRQRLADATRHGAEHGAHMRLQDQEVYLEDIEVIEEDEGGHHSRITLRNGLIIGGITGAAIVAALATVRYRRRRKAG